MTRKTKIKLAVIVMASLVPIMILGFCEVTFTCFLNHSQLLDGYLLRVMHSYYEEKDRNIIQFMPSCAVYDPDLAYRLKTGVCDFSNREFDVKFSVNSLGVRDDEDSLDSPEVVVLGDSFAMGWGVEQDETFAEVIAQKTGMKVLNTGVSSYGTAREFRMLERVDVSKLKYLIIQYCENDFVENNLFAKNKGELPIMSEDKYRHYQEKQADNVGYFFGKHTFGMVSALKDVRKEDRKTDDPYRKIGTPTDEARVFLEVIRRSGASLTNTRIMVFELNGGGKNDSSFIAALRKEISASDAPALYRNISVIDFSEVLKVENYFHLDDHINASGHEVVADSIAELMRSWN